MSDTIAIPTRTTHSIRYTIWYRSELAAALRTASQFLKYTVWLRAHAEPDQFILIRSLFIVKFGQQLTPISVFVLVVVFLLFIAGATGVDRCWRMVHC